MFRKFFEYVAGDVEERLVGKTILSCARLDARMVTAAQYFAGQETRGEHCQKLYADTFGANLKPAISQLFRQIHQHVELRELEELQIPAESENKNG